MKTIKQLLAAKPENEENARIADIIELVKEDAKHIEYISVRVYNVINGRMNGVCEDNYKPSQTDQVIDPEIVLNDLIKEGYVDVYDEVEALYYEVEVISNGHLPLKYCQELYINDTREVMTVNGTVENETMAINTDKE